MEKENVTPLVAYLQLKDAIERCAKSAAGNDEDTSRNARNFIAQLSGALEWSEPELSALLWSILEG